MDPNQTQASNPLVTPVQSITPNPTLQPEQPIANQPPIENPRKMPKFVGMLLLILLIVGLGGGTVIMNMMKKPEPRKETVRVHPSPTDITKPTVTPSPTTSATSSARWEKYTDKSLGYSFSYPADWKLDENRNTISSPDLPTHRGYASSGASISFSAVSTNETSIEQVLKKPHGGGPYENITDLLIDGIKAKRFDINWEGYTKNAQFIYKGNLYLIQLGSQNTEDLEKYTPVFTTILSSFKFEK